jgi:hypothetical protein
MTNLTNEDKPSFKQIVIKELAGVPTYLMAALVANYISTNMVAFFGIMTVFIVIYNLIYLRIFPKFRIENKKGLLFFFFFVQITFVLALYTLTLI